MKRAAVLFELIEDYLRTKSEYERLISVGASQPTIEIELGQLEYILDAADNVLDGKQ